MDIVNANHHLCNFKTIANARNFRLLKMINAPVLKGNIRLDFLSVRIARGRARLAARMAF